MALTFTCSRCGKVYKGIASKLRGKKVQCSCGKTMRLGPKLPKADKKQPPTAKSAPTEAPAQIRDVVVELVQPGFGEVDHLLDDSDTVSTPVIVAKVAPDHDFEHAAQVANTTPKISSMLPVPVPKPKSRGPKSWDPASQKTDGALTKMLPVITVVTGVLGILFSLLTLVAYFVFMMKLPIFGDYAGAVYALSISVSSIGQGQIGSLVGILVFILSAGLLLTSAAMMTNNLPVKKSFPAWSQVFWSEYTALSVAGSFIVIWIVLCLYPSGSSNLSGNASVQFNESWMKALIVALIVPGLIAVVSVFRIMSRKRPEQE